MCLITACNPSDTKPTPEGSIESPVITNDLSNQKVTAFAEDAQGHIWIGTSRGVNKYNVHEYHQYYCTDDSLDIPDNQINDLFRDSQGRLWVVTVMEPAYTQTKIISKISHWTSPIKTASKYSRTKTERFF